MTAPTTAVPLLLWLTPALLALLLYGLGQGFVKMWILEVPPARFCLYFACARAVVMVCYFFASPQTPVFASESRHLLAIGVPAVVCALPTIRSSDRTRRPKIGWSGSAGPRS